MNAGQSFLSDLCSWKPLCALPPPLQVRHEQASLKASLAEFGEQVRQLQAQMVHQASAEGEGGQELVLAECIA
jgi:hypothetical protein